MPHNLCRRGCLYQGKEIVVRKKLLKWHIRKQFFAGYASFFEKNREKVWWFQKKSVPLHPQIRNEMETSV